MIYLAERFKDAVAVLVGDGPIKQRLTTAYLEYLDDLEHDELPVELRAAFSDLHLALHQVKPASREPCVRASVRKMSSSEASAHAESIVMLFSELVRQGYRAGPLKVVRGEKKMALPSFLAGDS